LKTIKPGEDVGGAVCHHFLVYALTSWVTGAGGPDPCSPVASDSPEDEFSSYYLVTSFQPSHHLTIVTWASECPDVKITNDSSIRSGTGCLIAVPLRQQWTSKG